MNRIEVNVQMYTLPFSNTTLCLKICSGILYEFPMFNKAADTANQDTKYQDIYHNCQNQLRYQKLLLFGKTGSYIKMLLVKHQPVGFSVRDWGVLHTSVDTGDIARELLNWNHHWTADKNLPNFLKINIWWKFLFVPFYIASQ